MQAARDRHPPHLLLRVVVDAGFGTPPMRGLLTLGLRSNQPDGKEGRRSISVKGRAELHIGGKEGHGGRQAGRRERPEMCASSRRRGGRWIGTGTARMPFVFGRHARLECLPLSARARVLARLRSASGSLDVTWTSEWLSREESASCHTRGGRQGDPSGSKKKKIAFVHSRERRVGEKEWVSQ